MADMAAESMEERLGNEAVANKETPRAKVNTDALAKNNERVQMLKDLPGTLAKVPGQLWEGTKRAANQITDPRFYAPSTWINRIADSDAGQAIGESMQQGQVELLPGSSNEMSRVQQELNPDYRGVLVNAAPKIGGAVQQAASGLIDAAQGAQAPAVTAGPVAPSPVNSALEQEAGRTGSRIVKTPDGRTILTNLDFADLLSQKDAGQFVRNDVTGSGRLLDESLNTAATFGPDQVGGASTTVGGGSAGGGTDLVAAATDPNASFTDRLQTSNVGGLAGIAGLTGSAKFAAANAAAENQAFDRLNTAVNTNLSNVENQALRDILADVDVQGNVSQRSAGRLNVLQPSRSVAEANAKSAAIRAQFNKTSAYDLQAPELPDQPYTFLNKQTGRVSFLTEQEVNQYTPAAEAIAAKYQIDMGEALSRVLARQRSKLAGQ